MDRIRGQSACLAGSTHLYENVAHLRDGVKSNADGRFFYGRRGSPTQWSLAEALTEMEPGAAGTMLYPSGVAAISCALLAVLNPGDEILLADSSYDPSRSFADAFLKRMGISARYYDPTMGADIAELFAPNTKAILMESPGSLTFEVQDIPAICRVARDAGIVTLLDNTWATSRFFPALEHGVDIAITAATKYIVGHSDVMMGAVTTHSKYWTSLRRTAQQLGQVVCRRMTPISRRAACAPWMSGCASTKRARLKIAHWLKDRPGGRRSSSTRPCPTVRAMHIWKRDFSRDHPGSILVRAGGRRRPDRRAAFIDALDAVRHRLQLGWLREPRAAGGSGKTPVGHELGPDRARWCACMSAWRIPAI